MGDEIHQVWQQGIADKIRASRDLPEEEQEFVNALQQRIDDDGRHPWATAQDVISDVLLLEEHVRRSKARRDDTKANLAVMKSTIRNLQEQINDLKSKLNL